jgi:hypothetical protein
MSTVKKAIGFYKKENGVKKNKIMALLKQNKLLTENISVIDRKCDELIEAKEPEADPLQNEKDILVNEIVEIFKLRYVIRASPLKLNVKFVVQ